MTTPFAELPLWKKILSIIFGTWVLLGGVSGVILAGWYAWDWWEGRGEEAEACRRDAQCWGEKYDLDAQFVCGPLIERRALYAHQWTEGLGGKKFTNWYWAGASDDGIIEYRGSRLKFQNAFGVWAPMVYSCKYNTMTEEVISVEVTPR